MKVFDKIKDLFTDEVEEDEELPVKKEVIQVEIPAPKVSRRSNYEEFEEDKEDIIIEKKPVVPALPKKEEVSPFFDEKDFEDIKRGNYTLDDIYKEEEKEVEKKTYQEEKREAYSPKKEEPKKRFQPTPIISPVYGVLDKNYKKDDIVDKADLPRENRNITLDEVRNKAYGTLEDELENTLFGRTAILFQNNDDNESINDIEKDLESTAAAIDLLRDDVEVIESTDVLEKVKDEVKEEDEEPKKEESKILYEKKVIDDDDDELSLEDTIITDALKEDVPTDDKISEKDLFNLIDDMYSKGDK